MASPSSTPPQNILYFRKKTYNFTSSLGEIASYNLELPVSDNTAHQWKATISDEDFTIKSTGLDHIFLSLAADCDKDLIAQGITYLKGFCLVEIINLSNKVIYKHKGYTTGPDHVSFILKDFCDLTTLEKDNPNLDPKVISFRLTLGTCYDSLIPKSFESQKKMYDECILTDVVIKTKERLFKCHKFVLAAESDYFRAMFESKLKEFLENEIDWTDVFNANTVADLLHFLYTGQPPPRIEKTWLSLIEAADLCLLPRLKDMCEFTMTQIITVNNAVNILKAAEKFCSDQDEWQLKKSAVEFIVTFYPEVEKTDAWKNMEPEMAKRLMPTVFTIMHSKKP